MWKRSASDKIGLFGLAAVLSCFMAVVVDQAIAADTLTMGKLTPDAARLWSPGRLAVDQAGSLYVVDAYKNRVQKFDAAGTPQGTIRISRPSAVAAAPDGFLYIGSHSDYSVAAFKNGERTGYLGQGRSEFSSISDIAVDAGEGDIYVADTKANAVKIYTAAGAVKGRMGGFTAPVAVAVTASDVIVLDAPSVPCSTTITVKGKQVECPECTGRCSGARITVLDKAGTPVRSTTEASVNNGAMVRPVALAADALGNIYIADAFRKSVHVYDRTLSYVGSMASGRNDLNEPVSLSLSRDNSLYVSSSETRSIVEIGLAGTLHSGPTGTLTFQSKSGAALAAGALGY